MAVSKCGVYNLDEEGQEKKAHGDYDFPVAIYRDVLEEEEVAWHWHIEQELILVKSGEGYFSCNGSRFLLKEGQGLFVNSGILHSCQVSSLGHCELHSIVFHPRMVAGGTDTVFWTRYLRPLIENRKLPYCCFYGKEVLEKEVIDRIDRAWECIREEELGYEFAARALLSEIVLQLYRTGEKQEGQGTPGDIRKTNRLKQMMEFIQSNYTEDLKLSQIASSAMVSESECQRCFKNILHTTPICYLTDVRLQKACELLETTSFPAAKVAELSGLSDNSYFGKLFKRKMGMTPLEYRAEHDGRD